MNSDNWLSRLINWCQEFEQTLEKSSDQPLSKIAYQELSKLDWSHGFEHQAFIKQLFSLPQIPKQAGVKSSFGTPPFTIYFSEENNFYVEIYFWENAHTSIHDHGFEGAYQVISGSSIESRYEFSEIVEKNKDCSFGELLPKSLSLLKVGDTRKIVLGEKFIHRVLHLEKKTASLIVRSIKGKYIQKNYFFKCMSSPSWPEDRIVLKIRTLNWMLGAGTLPPNYFIEDLLFYKEFWETLFSFEHAKKFLKKLSILTFTKEQQVKVSDSIFFNLIFRQLKNVEDKILLSTYEYFEQDSWESWLGDNLSLSVEEARFKLKSGIEKTEEYQYKGIGHINFLRDLFS